MNIIYIQRYICPQTCVLDEAVTTHPKSWWWLKADGCDINDGLMESTSMIWNGDVDLGDGSLQQQYSAYVDRLANVKHVQMCGDSFNIASKLKSTLEGIAADLKFIHSGVWFIVIQKLVCVHDVHYSFRSHRCKQQVLREARGWKLLPKVHDKSSMES